MYSADAAALAGSISGGGWPGMRTGRAWYLSKQQWQQSLMLSILRPVLRGRGSHVLCRLCCFGRVRCGFWLASDAHRESVVPVTAAAAAAAAAAAEAAAAAAAAAAEAAAAAAAAGSACAVRLWHFLRAAHVCVSELFKLADTHLTMLHPPPPGPTARARP
jgi:hypothetical protein